MYENEPPIKIMPSTAGQQIATLFIHNPTARFTILYSHGNAEDLGTSQPFLYYLAQQGYNVFSYDYEGYGFSSGKPSEQGAYRSIQAAFKTLRDTHHIPAENIIVYGSSLGTGPSVDLAAKEKVAGLILQAPFVSAYRVKTKLPLIPFDKFVSIKKIKNNKAPVLIIHGTKDEIIPFWHGKELFDAANEPKRFVPIENGDHNNLINRAGQTFWQVIHEFSESLKHQRK